MYNPYLPREEPEFYQPEREKTASAGGLADSLRALKGLGGLRDVLGAIHLERLDSGDLLLLLVALLLWREGEEREFAIALGLVLLLEVLGPDSP